MKHLMSGSVRNSEYCFLGTLTKGTLVNLKTQVRSPVGGESVMHYGSKLTYSLGRTRLTKSLGKQQLQLLSCK